MVHLVNISKAYQGYDVIKNVSISLDRSRIYGLVGQNGSGKSVLMKIITGLVRPDSGTVTVMGKTIGKDVDFPPNTGILIEGPGFISMFSARKNLRLLAAYKNKIGNHQVDIAINLVGLNPSSRKSVGKYSMGMKQRLGIAQAVMEDPDLLILDEPFNGLDQVGSQAMRDLMFDLKNQGKTIFLSSHNTYDIELLCDDVFQIVDGVVKN
jgi:ABC-2 type transport system ATP-binding protein